MEDTPSAEGDGGPALGETPPKMVEVTEGAVSSSVEGKEVPTLPVEEEKKKTVAPLRKLAPKVATPPGESLLLVQYKDQGGPREEVGVVQAVKQGEGTKRTKPVKWSVEEDARLRLAVLKYDETRWKDIARMVITRNHVQCLQRWKKVLKPGLVKGQWASDEDERLVSLVEKGFRNWGQVASFMEGRTSKQCRERWCHHLDPTVRKGDYTAKEDDLIVCLQAEVGNKWAEIAKHLPGRTENAVKIRWKALTRSQKFSRKTGVSLAQEALRAAKGIESKDNPSKPGGEGGEAGSRGGDKGRQPPFPHGEAESSGTKGAAEGMGEKRVGGSAKTIPGLHRTSAELAGDALRKMSAEGRRNGQGKDDVPPTQSGNLQKSSANDPQRPWLGTELGPGMAGVGQKPPGVGLLPGLGKTAGQAVGWKVVQGQGSSWGANSQLNRGKNGNEKGSAAQTLSGSGVGRDVGSSMKPAGKVPTKDINKGGDVVALCALQKLCKASQDVEARDSLIQSSTGGTEVSVGDMRGVAGGGKGGGGARESGRSSQSLVHSKESGSAGPIAAPQSTVAIAAIDSMPSSTATSLSAAAKKQLWGGLPTSKSRPPPPSSSTTTLCSSKGASSLVPSAAAPAPAPASSTVAGPKLLSPPTSFPTPTNLATSVQPPMLRSCKCPGDDPDSSVGEQNRSHSGGDTDVGKEVQVLGASRLDVPKVKCVKVDQSDVAGVAQRFLTVEYLGGPVQVTKRAEKVTMPGGNGASEGEQARLTPAPGVSISVQEKKMAFGTGGKRVKQEEAGPNSKRFKSEGREGGAKVHASIETTGAKVVTDGGESRSILSPEGTEDNLVRSQVTQSKSIPSRNAKFSQYSQSSDGGVDGSERCSDMDVDGAAAAVGGEGISAEGDVNLKVKQEGVKQALEGSPPLLDGIDEVK
ncbi:unnamed protein product [Choristocarpus tenellus]